MKNDLEQVMDALLAIPKDEVKKPNIPVSIYVQEAVNLAVWSNEDKENLINVGLDSTLIDDLKIRAGACRDAQSNWVKDYKAMKEAEREWLKKAPDAFKLRDRLIDDFRYAYRKDDSVLSKVAIIADGTSREDMLQDLNDLSVLGKANIAPLEAVKFDLSKLDLAAETVNEMSNLLASAKGENGASEQLDIRNRSYTYLKQAVDELRAAGKYVFAEDESRFIGYRSEFLKKYRSKAAEDTEEVSK